MTDQTDYRLYLGSEFTRLNDKLDAIKEQTVKTNNRVTHLEEKVEEIDEALLEHPLKCDQNARINQIVADLEDYRVFKKYPKVFMFMVAFLVIGIIFSIYSAIEGIGSKQREREMIEMQQSTQEQVVRGEQYVPPAFKDTAPKVRYTDTADIDRILNKMK